VSKPMMIWIPLALLLIVVVLAAPGCASGTSAAGGLESGTLAPCPDSPNCVCSEDQGGAAIEPFALGEDPQASFEALVELIASRPRTEFVERRSDYAHAVVRTRLLGFKDDLELRLDRLAGVAQVRSVSRVGYSDLGANRARVESLRAAWQERCIAE